MTMVRVIHWIRANPPRVLLGDYLMEQDDKVSILDSLQLNNILRVYVWLKFSTTDYDSRGRYTSFTSINMLGLRQWNSSHYYQCKSQV